MDRSSSLPPETFQQEDPFGFIQPQDYESLGIDPAEIPPGTFAARKHPSKLLSRFGGNAYGFGFFEVYDRLNQRDLKLLQSFTLQDADQARESHKEINRIYKDLGLLIRFSSLGKAFYIIPAHLVLNSLSTIKSKADEISKIIGFHRKKFLKESHKIGLLTHADDQMINELTIRFKDHQFAVLDSFEKLRSSQDTLDMVLLTRDIHEVAFMDKFTAHPSRGISKKELEKYAFYVVGKVYHLLKPGGEIFVIASRFALERNRWIEVTFHTGRERKNFILFSHIFKTKKKYQSQGESLGVESFDFQKYLNPPYVEKEVIDSLLKGRSLEEMDLEEIHDLPYLNFSLDDPLAYDQEKGWSKLLSVYFNKIFLKSLLPDSIREDWQIRFSTGTYLPDYMLIYLGQKRTLETTLEEIKKDVIDSKLSGCPLPLLAGYRDSFDYLIGTLEVLRRIRSGVYPGLQQPFMDRLKGPFENKKRRYAALNDVLRLMSKVGRLQRIRLYFNPDAIEGVRTRVLDNLEVLSLFGFTHGELKEIFLIVVGHTAMGRILCGKTSEKTLKPVSDLARTYDPQEAINLLRYCRLMSMAETAASKKTDLNQEELAEIFDLHELMVRVVSNREMDWERLLDERISTSGGVKGEFMRQVLKMMNHYPFLANWSELSGKGEMEKEALAGYDEEKLLRMENVIRLVRIIDQFEKA